MTAAVSETALNAVADFFAKKKRHKPFKFNANLVDARAIDSTTHVDAPALTTEEPKAATAPSAASTVPPVTPEQPEPSSSNNASNNTGNKQPVEQPVMDMKSLQSTGGVASDNIAEKLRIEETKAQLAAARQGMERQAQKLAEEKAQKEAAAAEKAQASAATGGRWVAPHMRMMPSRLPGAQKLDTASEELFPDLQAAGKILEQKQQQTQSVVRVPKKTPVGGGATWANKPKLKLTSTPKLPKSKPKTAAAPTPTPPPPAKTEEKEPSEPKQQPAEEASPAAAETPAPAPAPAPAPLIQPKVTRRTGTKKKKKDLSTFKPGSAL